MEQQKQFRPENTAAENQQKMLVGELKACTIQNKETQMEIPTEQSKEKQEKLSHHQTDFLQMQIILIFTFKIVFFSLSTHSVTCVSHLTDVSLRWRTGGSGRRAGSGVFKLAIIHEIFRLKFGFPWSA